MLIKVSDVFSDAPGGRLRGHGPKSGQEFREDILLPAYENAQPGEKVVIDLDGCFGFATSFLEEAFGGLAREKGVANVFSRLEFVCNDEPPLIDEIGKYIKNACK